VESSAFTSSRRWPERARLALPLGSVLIAAIVVWRCPVAALLGVPCPGCGLTRAALALAFGDLAGAVGWHPLSPVLIPSGAWLGWRELARAALRGEPVARSRRAASERLVGVFAGSLVASVLVVWIARFFGAFGGPVPVSSHLHG
jgi:hypothetical protein